MKKLIALLMVAGMLAFSVGCSGSPTSSTGGKSGTPPAGAGGAASSGSSTSTSGTGH